MSNLPNDEEDSTIRNLDNLSIYEEIMPAIRAVIRAQGGADAILKRAEPLAAIALVKAAMSDKEDTAIRASKEILDRTQGKAIERTISIYADASQMSEQELDYQLLDILRRTNKTQVVETALAPKKSLTSKVKQSVKPRVSDPLADIAPDTLEVVEDLEATDRSSPTEE